MVLLRARFVSEACTTRMLPLSVITPLPSQLTILLWFGSRIIPCRASRLSSFQKLGVILRGYRLRLLQELGHLFFVERRWGRGTRRYRHAELLEESVIPRWSADSDHS